MANAEYVVGWVTVQQQKTMTRSGSRRIGDAHAVPADAGAGSRAVCGAVVDEVEPERTFPPQRGLGSAPVCPSCQIQITGT